jgi:hypothetical protein
MFSLRSKSRISRFLSLALFAWAVFGGLALAADEGGTSAAEAAESVKGPVWAMAYIVILLLVGLGTFATVRGSKRRDRAKPQEFAATLDK